MKTMKNWTIDNERESDSESADNNTGARMNRMTKAAAAATASCSFAAWTIFALEGW
jgi:hypothetical protein